MEAVPGIDNEKEKTLFKTLLTEIQQDIYPGDMTLKRYWMERM